MRSGSLGRTLCRAIAVPFALVLLANAAAAGPADTRKQISAAQQRLAALGDKITAGESRVMALQSSMRTLARQVGSARSDYEAIQKQIARTRARNAEVEAEYRAVRTEMNAAATNAYIRGPAYGVEALMNIDDLSDASYVLAYTDAITRHDAMLAASAKILAQRLAKQQGEESALVARRGEAVANLNAAQTALMRAFADEQARMDSLAAARAQLGALLAKLRAQLQAEEIAAALEALAHGTPVTFGKWATAFLATLHAPVARNNLVVIVAWETAEFTQARWNPLATTYPMTGATAFNGSGVRNYVSMAQGIDASIRTLRRPGHGYESILADLARAVDPMTTAHAINDSDWCHGCANGQYVIDLIPSVEQYYDRYASAHS